MACYASEEGVSDPDAMASARSSQRRVKALVVSAAVGLALTAVITLASSASPEGSAKPR